MFVSNLVSKIPCFLFQVDEEEPDSPDDDLIPEEDAEGDDSGKDGAGDSLDSEHDEL